MTPPADTFEDRLLGELLERFEDLAHRPAAVVRSVHRRALIRRSAVPVACVAATATATAVILELGGPGVPAPVTHPLTTDVLAAWTAQPSAADRGQVSAAEDGCSAVFDQAGGAQPNPAEKSGPPLPGGPWHPTLVDTRGDLTLALYSDGTHWVACLDSPSVVSLHVLDTYGQPPVADNSAALDMMSTGDASGDLYTVAVGRSGSAVTGVGLQRRGGSVVTSTVANGLYVAWWPGDDGVESLSVTTNSGTQTYPVDPRFDRSGPQPSNKTIRLSGPPSNRS